MIKIGNIELVNIVECQNSMCGKITLKNEIVGMLEVDFLNDESMTVNLAIDSEKKDILVKEVMCNMSNTDEERSYDFENLFLNLVKDLIHMYKSELEYRKLREIYEMDSYLKISYKNVESAIIPSNNPIYISRNRSYY